MKTFSQSFALFLVSLAVVSCSQSPSRPNIAAALQESGATALIQSRPFIRIATFNVQNFGKQKMGRPPVVATLVDIVRKYDIVAMQELSDVSNYVPGAFLTQLNAIPGARYGLVLSERTGREPDDRTSAEQYAFYYNTDTIEAQNQADLYPDSARDDFQREPFAAGFRVRATGINFVLITIHTRPEASREEIPALARPLAWARSRFSGQDGFVILGDFNASGSYASSVDLDRWRTNDLPYLWIVPDTSDSAIGTGANRAYDRIIATDGMARRWEGQWGIDKAFTDRSVSDHWPVWAEFRMDPR